LRVFAASFADAALIVRPPTAPRFTGRALSLGDVRKASLARSG